MAQPPRVPQFGNWDNEEVPYTVVFEKARKGRSGTKSFNPNEPLENQDGFPHDNLNISTPDKSVPSSEKLLPFTSTSAPQFKHEVEVKQSTSCPDAPDSGTSRIATNSHHPMGANSSDYHRRTSMAGAGLNRSTEPSPLHPHQQVKASSKSGTATWERKGSSEGSHDLAPSTPGRSRLRPATLEEGVTVPKFGDWNEKNLTSGDGYTHIFNEVRKERVIGSAKVPVLATESSYTHGKKRESDGSMESMWCCCFSGGRK